MWLCLHILVVVLLLALSLVEVLALNLAMWELATAVGKRYWRCWNLTTLWHPGELFSVTLQESQRFSLHFPTGGNVASDIVFLFSRLQLEVRPVGVCLFGSHLLEFFLEALVGLVGLEVPSHPENLQFVQPPWLRDLRWNLLLFLAGLKFPHVFPVLLDPPYGCCQDDFWLYISLQVFFQELSGLLLLGGGISWTWVSLFTQGNIFGAWRWVRGIIV